MGVTRYLWWTAALLGLCWAGIEAAELQRLCGVMEGEKGTEVTVFRAVGIR